MKEVEEYFKALSDNTRLKIIESLFDGEKCVCEIIPYTNIKQSTVSIQLSVLVNAGILGSRKQGKKVFYRIIDKRVCEILKILKLNNNILNEKCCCSC